MVRFQIYALITDITNGRSTLGQYPFATGSENNADWRQAC